MIRFRAFGTDCRLHVLALLFAALGYALGVRRELPHIFAAVFVHETAHIIAARLAGMDIEYVEIMPFGGAAYIRDIYNSGRAALIAVAAAGPAANLALSILAAALAWWDVLPVGQAAVFIRINVMLACFNMLPALPLDGGRIFYAIAGIWLHERAALRVCAALAYILAGLLATLCAVLWWGYGTINLTLLIIAVFVTAATLKEMREYTLDASPAFSALTEAAELPAAARLIAFPEDIPPARAIKYLKHGAAVFAIIGNGSVKELVTGDEMARRALER